MLDTRKTLRMSSKEFQALCSDLGLQYDDEDGIVILSSRMAYRSDSFYKVKEFVAYNVDIIAPLQSWENVNGLFFVFGEDFGRPVLGKLESNFAHVGLYPPKRIFGDMPDATPKLVTFADYGDVKAILARYQEEGFLGATKADFTDMDSTMDCFWDLYLKR